MNCPAHIELLASAAQVLERAAVQPRPQDRYSAAYLAALRAAAAVLSARARPRSVGGRPASCWSLLERVAPELAEWARFFALGSGKRAAAEAGMAGAVTAREADDLLRDAAAFLRLAMSAVERSAAQPHPLLAAG